MRRHHVLAALTAARGRTPDAVTLLVLALVGLATLAAVGTAAVGLGAVGDADAASGPADLPPPDSYAVVQGDRCRDVSPVTGTDSVESAYEYRNPFPNVTGNPPDQSYSAFGFTEYQLASASTMFVYSGQSGDSLVILNGELDAPEANGSTARFEFENLPASGEWAIRDDEYPNPDDDWSVSPTRTTVDWVWASERTDGGAYRGIENTSGVVRIDAQFNDAAPRWGVWNYSGSPEHRVDRWRVVDADGRTVLLSMDEPTYLAPGGCDALPTANASIDATPGEVPRGRSVTLSAEATGAGADLPILEYRWDLTGDGTVDRVTETPSVDHRYDTAGQYSPSVRVHTAAGTGDPERTALAVGQSNEPAVSVTGVDGAAGIAGEPTTVTVELVNDGGGAGSVDLTVVADGEVVGERTAEVGPLSTSSVDVGVTYPDAGEYEVSVNGAETTVSVTERTTRLRVESLTADDRVVAGRSVRVSATLSNDGNVRGEFDVALELSGEVVANRTVQVGPDETRTVEFDHPVEEPGTVGVAVGERSAEVEVVEVDPELSVERLDVGGPVDAGASATITAVVENTGNAEGTFDVPLELFGEVVAVRTVTLDSGEQATVEFSTAVDEPGTYTARVADQSADLSVVGPDGTTTAESTATPADGSVPLAGPSVLLTAAAVATLVALVALGRHRDRR